MGELRKRGERGHWCYLHYNFLRIVYFNLTLGLLRMASNTSSIRTHTHTPWRVCFDQCATPFSGPFLVVFWKLKLFLTRWQEIICVCNNVYRSETSFQNKEAFPLWLSSSGHKSTQQSHSDTQLCHNTAPDCDKERERTRNGWVNKPPHTHTQTHNNNSNSGANTTD